MADRAKPDRLQVTVTTHRGVTAAEAVRGEVVDGLTEYVLAVTGVASSDVENVTVDVLPAHSTLVLRFDLEEVHGG